MDDKVIPVISGSGRSGTTWVLDVLARANNMRAAFEPLHPVVVPKMADYAGRYIHANEDMPELNRYLTNIFNGDYRNIWVDYRVRKDRLSPAYRNLAGFTRFHEYIARWRKLYRQYRMYSGNTGKTVLTKFIRANLMYTWILANFNARIIHITRHPCAVIESKLRLGGDDWDVDDELARCLKQKPVTDWVHGYIPDEDITGLSVTGKYALIWCIENILSMTTGNDDLLKVYYESLASHDTASWQTICSHLSMSNIPESDELIKPSQQARPENRDTSYSKDVVSSWSERMTDADKREIEAVLKLFNVSDYAVDMPEPILN